MNEDLLYRLALRLTTFPGDPNVDNPSLLVGSVPQPLPATIPFPPGHQILGSLIRGPQSLQIFLDVPLTTEEINDFYESALEAEGWQTSEEALGFEQGGFVHTMFNRPNYLHLEHDTGLHLNIQIAGEQAGMNDVRLTLKSGESAQSIRANRRRMHGPDMYAVLPQLVPPKGAAQLGGGGGGSSDSVNSQATLQLKAPRQIADLAQHYTKQLVQAGWTLIADEQTEHSAWSSWQFHAEENQEWLAAFHLFQLPGDQIQYQLSLRADLKKTLSANGWFTPPSL